MARSSSRKTTSSATSGSKRSSDKQKGEDVSDWASSSSYFVYENDSEVSSGMSKATATALYKLMPTNTRKRCKIMTFDSKEEYSAFFKSFSASKETTVTPVRPAVSVAKPESSGSVVTPEKPKASTNHSSALEALKNRIANPVSSPYSQTKHASDASKGQLDILNRLKKVVALPPNVVKIHFFPNIPLCAKVSVAMLEFCKRSDGYNMWLHKPEAWQAVREADIEHLIIPEELQDLHYCIQRAQPFCDGTVEKSKKVGNFTVKASGLWFPLDSVLNEKEICKFVCDHFSSIIDNPNFHECYSTVVSQLGSSSKTMQAIPGYYKDFLDALKPELVLMVPHFSLDELFLTKTISEVMRFVAGCSLPDASIKKYSNEGYELNHYTQFAFKP